MVRRRTLAWAHVIHQRPKHLHHFEPRLLSAPAILRVGFQNPQH